MAGQQPFKTALEGDMKVLAESGERGLAEIVMSTHAGMTTEEFAKIVSEWLATARDPRFKRPYTELVYQPMIELLALLRANGFKTFIVSGGGVEFMRPWTERVHGVPPEQVVGSSIKTKFQMRDGTELFCLPEVNFIDDKAGQSDGLGRFCGDRTLAARIATTSIGSSITQAAGSADMVHARQADSTGNKSSCDQALAEIQRTMGPWAKFGCLALSGKRHC
jgi:hypothetical protein